MPPNSSASGGSSPVTAEVYQSLMETPFKNVVLGLSYADDLASEDTTYAGESFLETFETAIYGGSPYALVEAYSPDTAIDRIRDRYDDFRDAAQSHDPDLDLQTALEKAALYYDANVDTTTKRTAVINNFIDRQEGDFARAVTRVGLDAFTIRGILSTQTTMAFANLETDRALEQTEFSSRLDLAADERRANAIVQLANTYLSQNSLKTEALRTAWALEMETGRLEVTLKQDETEFNLEMEARDALYDLDLFPHFFGAIGALNGAALTPRAQTRRERAAAAFQIAASTGLQVGSTLGPAAGGIAGVATLATQLWALGGDN